ncbi:hypothetical protein PUNSTDRAFT_70027 [Punctularia strigosozonata HHB-11173 SS5]|uniref:uncharacterized protein n=1 Tax=Punctularia strigosozonata (strain HHB-11173) TaxID=741275 RepID=UPI0004417FFB|nr:uncharacterized protein PUNSTDRAFT_70027 [Punctularia strigosozonata HHB-11173 SS5]EIN08045.1 hypothetical protein PUNSTDRAFT_70027 [Punctularia strigosozonata HHB-11173 SS5]
MASPYTPLDPINPQPIGHGALQPIPALSFDPSSDTLWTGTDSGTVIAMHSSHGVRGVSFKVGGRFGVKKVIAGDNYVLSMASELGLGVGSWGKGGMNKWYSRPSATALTFSNVSTSSQALAVSTVAPELVMLNPFTGAEIRRISTSSAVTHLQFSHLHLLSGSRDGYLRAHDPRTGLRKAESGAELSVKAHAGSFQGLASSGNYIYTIGCTVRQGTTFPEPLVKIHDIRTMRPIAPVPFSEGPAFIDVLPRLSSSIVITSSQGLVNIVDVSKPDTTSDFYQLETASYISSSAVSPTGAYLGFGDGHGYVHLLTNVHEVDEEHPVPLNGFEGKTVEWAPPPEPAPELPDNASVICVDQSYDAHTQNSPLNSVGLPYYTEPLFSSWSASMFSPDIGFPAPPKIPNQILHNLKITGGLASATLPKELKGRRNVVSVGMRKDQARFRSGKMQRSVSEPETPQSSSDVPKIYRKVEIEYSKFGVEDFDFGYYNKTEFSGLETHILQSYTNSIVQSMHYLHPIRRLAKSHIITNCPHEHCLLCELGFVSRMLEDARGINCQASNFCKTVGVLAQVHNQMELLDYGIDGPSVDWANIIQSFNRFLVERLNMEANVTSRNPLILPRTSLQPQTAPPVSPITQLMGIDAKNVVVCTTCKGTREKANLTHVIDMVYPRANISANTQPAPDISSVLSDSLRRQTTHRATCQSCRKMTVFETTRIIPAKDLPPILAVNASVYNEESLKIWQDGRRHRFLTPTTRVKCGDSEEDVVEYELRAMTIEISDRTGPSHLCAIIKVPEAEGRNDLMSPWFLFNDFAVRNIPESEALGFPEDWKIPTVLYLERMDIKSALDYSKLPEGLDPTILCRDTNIAIMRDKNLIKHECLRPDELPRPGTIVSIDAEFVLMQQEETEFRSDGSKKVLRPARLSLARVSVLRGDGPKEGVPFIDDHIHTSEVIVDYLTEFSGIRFGDLDPHLSRHTLTPLKLVYKKLRLLVDRGCIFIGHGLSKDFRIINIFVPPDQVIDTVDLYFIKSRQRRLSLRFLTWAILQENIQQETHDSIEDARSALRLFKKFNEFEEAGVFDQKLEELYRTGKEYVCLFTRIGT